MIILGKILFLSFWGNRVWFFRFYANIEAYSFSDSLYEVISMWSLKIDPEFLRKNLAFRFLRQTSPKCLHNEFLQVLWIITPWNCFTFLTKLRQQSSKNEWDHFLEVWEIFCFLFFMLLLLLLLLLLLS